MRAARPAARSRGRPAKRALPRPGRARYRYCPARHAVAPEGQGLARVRRRFGIEHADVTRPRRFRASSARAFGAPGDASLRAPDGAVRAADRCARSATGMRGAVDGASDAASDWARSVARRVARSDAAADVSARVMPLPRPWRASSGSRGQVVNQRAPARRASALDFWPISTSSAPSARRSATI